MKKFWLNEKVDVICTMPSGGTLCAIMSNRILTILFLFITQISFSQILTVEAVYYDNHEAPYKIERKYADNDNVTYITHDNHGSVCVKRQTSNSGDTTIIKEASYRIFNKKTKIEEFQDCDNWMVSSNSAGDTVWLKGYKMDYSPDTMILVGDTMLTGASANNSWDFSERIKKARVPLILKGGMKVDTDSLILNETVIAYFIKGIPIKVERFDAKNNKQSMITAVIKKNEIIYKRYFTKDGPNPYQVDTVSFNADTTKIRRSSTRFEWKQTYVSEFQIKGTILQVNYNDTTKREIEYLDNRNIFSNILIGDLIYSDVLYYMELRYFDREKTMSVKTKGQTSNNKYSFDTKNRIVEQISYDKGQLQKRVTYKYED